MLDVDQLLGYLVQLTLIGGGIGGMYLAVKRWVKDISGNTKKTAKQLETSNGRTVGQYVEDSAKQLDEIAEYGKENRTLIRHVADRLDAHLKGHP